MTAPLDGDRPYSRRDFLIRAGVVGAVVAVGGAGVRTARAGPVDDLPLETAREATQRLARDTIRGLVVLTVPSDDPYSRAQGVTSPTPGAIQTKGDEVLLEGLDNFLPIPDRMASELAAAFATGVSHSPLPDDLLGPLAAQGESGAARLDDALEVLVHNDEAIPLSLLVAMLLNFEASLVDPRSPAGPFPASPFANLSAADKAEVFRRLEQPQPELVALIDSRLPEPGKESVSGTIQYVAGTLLEFNGFVAYTEFGVFDRERLVATERPISWDISNYLPGRRTPVDGRDELLGYYQGRREVDTAPEFR
ncbi:MAG: hypothetical protein GEV09_02695 [Pseudonocardiaceae bacterium]|nr:hypothetical protein [Pseudonocardiaceae bacterium]